MKQKRTTHNKEIGYGHLKHRFLIDRDHASRKHEFLVRVAQRVHGAVPPQEKEIVIYGPVLPAFIRHLERCLAEIREAEKNSTLS
jgi:hypothetical protein